MQTVSTVILLQLVFCAVEGELTTIDTVCITTYRRTIVTWRVQCVSILCNVVIAQNNVCWLTVLVRNYQRYYTATIVGDTYFHTICVGKGVKLYLLSVDGCVECCRVET